MMISRSQIRRGSAHFVSVLLAGMLTAAAGEVDVSVRRITDPSHGTTRLVAMAGTNELASIETVDPRAQFGCRAPQRLKPLAQLRDLLASHGDATARRFVSSLLGPYANTPADLIPEDATEEEAGFQDCSAKVKYRYNTCAGDCGTVDGHEVTCTCEVTSPVTCPNLIKPPRLEIPIS